MKPNAAVTTREACAREIECMARGHVAHEMTWLLEHVPALRALPEAGSPASAILAAARVLNDAVKKAAGHHADLLGEARDRILFMVPEGDPMEPYNDRGDWWPRKQNKEPVG